MSKSTRLILAVTVLAGVLFGAAVAVGQVFSVTEDGPEIIPDDSACAEVLGLHVQTFTCTRPFDDQPTTTTTEATTTTTEATTTTTEGETTTTTAPPTGLVIPPTQPYPARGSGVPYRDGGSYDIMANNAETGVWWWTAPYWAPNGLTAYPGGGGWINGDREGYRCAYGFIEDDDGSLDGRFAFVRPPNQAYGKVNDAYMEEGQRYLDGTVYTGGGMEITEEDCTDVLSPIDYTGACRDVDERPRVGFFDGDGNVLDIRDYTNTDAPNVNFNLHGFDGERATVIACENGLVGMIVYYDAMGDGEIAVDLDGVVVTP